MQGLAISMNVTSLILIKMSLSNAIRYHFLTKSTANVIRRIILCYKSVLH